MELKKIVASYAAEGKEVDLKGLAENAKVREAVVSAVVKAVKEKPHACVVFPSYKQGGHLGQLINEVALSLQVDTLVTGNVRNIANLRQTPAEVIIIKQSFRAGQELKSQIAEIKSYGCGVSVLCLIAHSKAKVDTFAKENDVEVSALVYTD